MKNIFSLERVYISGLVCSTKPNILFIFFLKSRTYQDVSVSVELSALYCRGNKESVRRVLTGGL